MKGTRLRGWIGFVVLVTVAGCGGILVPGDELMVRVENASSVTFSDLSIYPADSVFFGDVGPGQRTDYRQVSRAYAVATVVTVIEGESFRLQVIDHVGESPLRSGSYTYVIGFVDGGFLTLELRREG